MLKKTYSDKQLKDEMEHDEGRISNEDEPLCQDNPNRFCLFPIQYHDMWNAYKRHKNSFWTAEEVDFSADKKDWLSLTDNERYFIENVLAFFAGSDGIVLENLMTNFCKEVMIPEARCFYSFQAMMENIHCVSADTLILTKNGFLPISSLVNQTVDIWNGEQFTPVVVRYTGDQELYRVELENGFSLTCTSDHDWYLLQDGVEVKCKTRHLIAGDEVFPYDLPRVRSTSWSDIDKNHPMSWLDGMITLDEDPPGLGSMKWSNTDLDRNHVSNLFIRSIDKLDGVHPTYCFNEPLRGRGVFNGVLTGQSEVYSLMIDSLITDVDHKNHLFQAVSTIPCIRRKAEWAIKWIHETTKSTFATRLYAFGIVEGLFFSGSFCAIFWLKERGLMVNALGKSNEWIARDESLHTEFAVLLYSYVKNRLTNADAHRMMYEAVMIEEEFICDSLPVDLIGMNSDLMRVYIRYVADRLLLQFGYEKLFNVQNPFAFMEKISLDGKTNFFEQRVSEYSMIQQTPTSFPINLDDDNF